MTDGPPPAARRSAPAGPHAPPHAMAPPRACRALVAALLLVAAPARAQFDLGFDFSTAGSGGFQFLKIGMGAREAALGEAAAALTDDASAVFWNVGALPMIEGPTASFGHADWLAGSTADALVVAAPVGSYALALSALRFGLQPFEETTVLEPDGTGRMAEAGDLLVGFAASKRFTDRLTIGVQAKYVRERLDQDAYSDVLFDVGTVYYTGFRDLRLAFTLQHFGPDAQGLRQDFRTPLLFRVAVADDLIDTASLRVSSAVELVHPTDNNEWVNWGVESVLLDVLALRAGYRLGVEEGQLTFGAGVRPPAVGGLAIRADYAYARFGDVFGATHRFTVGLSRR